jgi:hypothetical protein
MIHARRPVTEQNHPCETRLASHSKQLRKRWWGMSNRQYVLVVDRELSDELSKWFAGMTPTRKAG